MIVMYARIAVLLVFALVAAGCMRTEAVTPTPRATPQALTPSLDAVIRTYDDALTMALPNFTGRGSTVTLHELESISYVETTLGRALLALDEFWRGGWDEYLDDPVWLFVAYGRFQAGGNGRKGPVHSASWQIALKDTVYVWGALTSDRYDLSQLGEEHVIQPGEVPELDAVRVAATPVAATPAALESITPVPQQTAGSAP